VLQPAAKRSKGPQVFTDFVRDGLRGGYESAPRKHYGADFGQFGQQWQQQVLGTSRIAASGAHTSFTFR